MKQSLYWLILLAGLMAGQMALSANDEDLETVRAGVQQIGKQFNPRVLAATRDLYLPLQKQASRDGVRIINDISYGNDELHTIDIYLPQEKPASAPIIVFLHGGGMVAGDKDMGNTDGLLYGNIPTFFARQGMIGINANYRLVPDIHWPQGAEDIRDIVAWIKDNILDFGGDPESIFLMGSSAGASHVATYLFHEPSHLTSGSGVIGGILNSGSFSASDNDVAKTYYGEDRAQREKRVGLGLISSYQGSRIPIFLLSAQLDSFGIETSVAKAYAMLCDKYEDCPKYVQLHGHNHVSGVMSFNSIDDQMSSQVLEFVQDVLNPATNP